MADSGRGPLQSRHLVRMANLICFPVYHVYFFDREWAKSIVKLGGHDRIASDLTLFRPD